MLNNIQQKIFLCQMYHIANDIVLTSIKNMITVSLCRKQERKKDKRISKTN